MFESSVIGNWRKKRNGEMRKFFNFVILENTKEMDFLAKGIKSNKLIVIYDNFEKLFESSVIGNWRKKELELIDKL